jgi:hypothetical protein
MRIGFTNIYAWRPHVEHMQYLALLAQAGGHDIRYLACDSDFPSCYSRELRPHSSRAWECFKCMSGSSRSYAASGVSGIGKLLGGPADSLPAQATDWTRSSANTLWRFESPSDFASAQAELTAQELAAAAGKAYAATLRWIERERLDGICLYNGRMDATRGVLEAARHAGIPFVSVERSWFGDGLWLLPGENCLGLRNVDRMVASYADAPLTARQSALIARQVASRFMGVNATEWRAYNREAIETAWPHRHSGPRVLMLPSSRNEFFGHEDWACQWPEPTQAIEAVMDQLGLRSEDCVLRCHPNWSEAIGHATGAMPERYYTDWATRRGIKVISSADRSSTLSLINQSDAIIVNGSSAALDAGVLGKQVIATGPGAYQAAGYADLVYGPREVHALQLRVGDDHVRHNARQALRFGYSAVGRVPQFVDQVRGDSSFEYRYYDGADPNRLVSLLETQSLHADDPVRATTSDEEDRALDAIEARAWAEMLRSSPKPPPQGRPLKIERRPMFRAVDALRRLRPIGDR